MTQFGTLIGGVAAFAHGSSRMTADVDVVYARDEENLQAIAAALAPLDPYIRGAPIGLPFQLDTHTLRNGLNFTLTTSAGSLDLLGEVAGQGTYASIVADSISIDAYGVRVQCVNLERLIQLKRAAGRPKDLESVAELEALLEEAGR